MKATTLVKSARRLAERAILLPDKKVIIEVIKVAQVERSVHAFTLSVLIAPVLALARTKEVSVLKVLAQF